MRNIHCRRISQSGLLSGLTLPSQVSASHIAIACSFVKSIISSRVKQFTNPFFPKIKVPNGPLFLSHTFCSMSVLSLIIQDIIGADWLSTPIPEVFLVKVVFFQWHAIPDTICSTVLVNRHNRGAVIEFHLPQQGLVRCRNIERNALMVGIVVDVPICFPPCRWSSYSAVGCEPSHIPEHLHHPVKGVRLNFPVVPVPACNDVIHVQFLVGHVVLSLIIKVYHRG